MKRTAKQAILDRLAEAGQPLACHELNIIGYSENALATRLSDLHMVGKVVGRIRPGFQFKEWRLATSEEAAAILGRRVPA